jgi:membrane protein implicated in regulation of membrane protease activity
MTWENFYLVCFVVGFAFSVLSFLSGGLRWRLPFKWHLPHSGPNVHGGPHVHLGHARGVRSGGARAGAAQVSPFNFLTLTIFLAWFGGTGYLLTRYSTVWFLLGLAVALFSGIGGAAIVFGFLRALISSERPMDPADYEMVGVLGKVSSPIRAGGTGEITYTQGGTRHAAGARSEEGSAIAKGSEVVVTRYERGIAYVRRWEEMAGMEDAPAPQQASSAKEGSQ